MGPIWSNCEPKKLPTSPNTIGAYLVPASRQPTEPSSSAQPKGAYLEPLRVAEAAY